MEKESQVTTTAAAAAAEKSNYSKMCPFNGKCKNMGKHCVIVVAVIIMILSRLHELYGSLKPLHI